MRKESGVVHAVVQCETCGKEFIGYKNAQGLGAQHAKVYGHVVSGEIGIAFRYDGTDEKIKKRKRA